jgi:16S rRNA (adenine1518-N6/adenine1519-N6)-dimethyltransferase
MSNKRLGQHFLINKQIIADIIHAGNVSKKDVVLEVGPGKGILTAVLAEKAKKVIAVEKDRELVEYLENKFGNQKNVEIIYSDILDIENWKLKIGNYKIVANIPYYITSHFLKLFLSEPDFRPSLMVLMIQKEVAERIVARNGKESLLSLSVKAYGKPEIIKVVRKGNFSPPPKVDSAIIKIANISDDFFRNVRNRASHISDKKFFDTLRKAFQQKRKMLRHSLGKNIPEKYQNKRPEELKLEDWTAIYLFQSPLSQAL